ncbi:MAG: FtsX-like permease family protein [Planctomycetota bacterium]|nr:FtsX-like permease family protein [Planctomycetota bacterium]
MYILSVALRYMRSRSITWVAMLLIAANVVLYLLIISVLEGFKEHYMNKLQSIHAHITVDVGCLSWGIQKPEEWADAVAKADPGIKGVTVGLESPAMALFDSARTVGTLRGIDLERELRTGRLGEMLYPRNLAAELHEFGMHEQGGMRIPGCIVGGAWRRSYGLKAGDRVTFLFSNDDGDPRSRAFHILGFFEGKNQYLETAAYVDRRLLARLVNPEGTEGAAKTLYVWLHAPSRPDLAGVAGKVRATMLGILKAEVPRHASLLSVETWQQKDNSFYHAITSENRMMRIIMFMSLALIGFIMFLIFGRLVAEKVRDIGALRALGATPAGIRWCFLAQAVLISTVGLIVGLAGAYFAIRNVNCAVNWIAEVFRIDLFPGESFGPDRVPTRTLPFDVLIIVGLSIACSWLGAFIPAWRASRMNPVECLRHE